MVPSSWAHCDPNCSTIVSIMVSLFSCRHPPAEKQLLFPFLRVCSGDAEINENMDASLNDQNIALLNLDMKDTKQVKT